MTKKFEYSEGATPLSDCSGLIPTWVHTINDLNRVEAENIIHAQRKFLRGVIDHPKNWFRIAELKAIHLAMFGNVWEWAGSFRKSVLNIGVEPTLIPSKLAEFCFEVLSWLQYPVELTFIEMAARIHQRLTFIHPFENGNGRFSRLIADRYLLAWKCPYPIWPNLDQKNDIRSEYIHTLKSADKGDYEPLIGFMEKLGAADPKLSELMKNNFYHPYLDEEKGILMVKALLRRGSNPNDMTLNGHRTLHLAVKAGLEKIAKLLVEAGAEKDVKDKSGLTPFQMAISVENKSLSDFFLSLGAKPVPPPGIGYTKYYKLYNRF
ncbi:MAG: mobile mystery protein B [Chlamydiae bacterium]|nr:mobile mystery protein B [Chlamydiota bacterium]